MLALIGFFDDCDVGACAGFFKANEATTGLDAVVRETADETRESGAERVLVELDGFLDIRLDAGETVLLTADL